MQLQVTVFHETNKYKPLSTLVEIPMRDVVKKNFTPYKLRAMEKILAKKRCTLTELQKQGFTKVTSRIYDKEKIAEENQKRYDELKRQKFASGEWKPSKKDIEKGLTKS